MFSLPQLRADPLCARELTRWGGSLAISSETWLWDIFQPRKCHFNVGSIVLSYCHTYWVVGVFWVFFFFIVTELIKMFLLQLQQNVILLRLKTVYLGGTKSVLYRARETYFWQRHGHMYKPMKMFTVYSRQVDVLLYILQNRISQIQGNITIFFRYCGFGIGFLLDNIGLSWELHGPHTVFWPEQVLS